MNEEEIRLRAKARQRRAQGGQAPQEQPRSQQSPAEQPSQRQRIEQASAVGNLYSPQNRDMFTGAPSPEHQTTALDPVEGDPTQVTNIVDNVVGLDNGVMTPGEKAGTALNNAGESMTLGVVGDEAAAAFDNALGRGSYQERLKFYRDNQEQLGEENPMLSFASQVAPALIPGMGGAKLVAALTTKLGRVGAGAVLGALSGATYGFAEGEGDARNRLDNATGSAVAGGLFGASAPKIADTLSGIPRRISQAFKRSEQRPTIENLRAAKNMAYRAVEEAGEEFSVDEMNGLFNRVSRIFESGNYVEDVDNASRATLRILERNSDKPATIGQLDRIRQGLWSRYNSAKDQPMILDAIGEIDDLIASRAETSELMTAARAANSRYAKSQLLDDAFTKAEDQTASTGSGGNILNKYRQAVTSIINNPKKSRFFTDEEIDVMRQFVRGTPSENLRRLVGKMSPNGNGLMMTLHAVGGMASGGATLPLMVAGAAAKNSADRAVERGAREVQDMVSGYRPAGQPELTRLGAGSATASGVIGEQTAPLGRNALDHLR